MMTRQAPNSWIGYDPDANTTLRYAFQVNPTPLVASVTGEDATIGSLQVVITNPTDAAVTVNSVTFEIPVGTGASLMQSTEHVATDSSDTINWKFRAPGSPITSGTANFVLDPASGSGVSLGAGDSVVVEIFDFPTVLAPATASITIKELTNGSITPAFGTIQVTTFPAGFFFTGLTASIGSGSDLRPVAQVAANTAVTLTWNSSVVDTQRINIHYTNASQGQQTTNPSVAGMWISPGLTVDTVFTVHVEASVEGGQPMRASMSIAVSVQNPALIAGSINTGSATVTGATTANALTATEVTVNGSTQLNGTLTTTGDISTSGTINSSAGTSSLSALNVATLNATNATVSTALTATAGTVAMLTAPKKIGSGTFVAHTDGFVVGIVDARSVTVSNGSVGWVYASANGVTVAASGGVIAFTLGGFVNCSMTNSQTCTLPVSSGTEFSTLMDTPSGTCQQQAPGTAVWWIPLGTPAGGGSTLTQLSDKPAVIFPEPSSQVRHMDVGTPVVNEFVAVLEEFVGREMPDETKRRLARLLQFT